MTIILSVLLGSVSLICFLGGINILLKGAMSFLPNDIKPQLVLDNLIRFLSGIYFGSGFLIAYCAFNVANIGVITYFLGIIVIFSGIGRLYSKIKLGSAGKYFDNIMLVEILLGLIIIVIKFLIT